MYYSVNQTKKVKLIKELHEKCFPGEEFYEHKKNKYWIAVDRNGKPLGFGVATDFGEGILFFSRSGVLKQYRGNGIHKKLIKVRLRFSVRRKFKSCITYTAIGNHASVNNLTACGFKAYTPSKEYVGKDFNYWLFDLT